MTDLRTAAQQALEALQGIYIAPEHDHYINAWWPACRDAIPVLRAALAQQTEPQATHSTECWRWHHKCAVAKIERECKHD